MLQEIVTNMYCKSVEFLTNQVVQRRMVSVVIFSNFFFCFVFAIFDLVHGGCGGYIWPMVTTNSILKSFLKYE